MPLWSRGGDNYDDDGDFEDHDDDEDNEEEDDEDHKDEDDEQYLLHFLSRWVMVADE